MFSCERKIVIQCILDEICSWEDYRLVYSFCDQNKMMQLGWLLVSASPSFIICTIQPVDCAVWFNTSHWRMVFNKPCNCLHRMCSHSACYVSAFWCGCWVYCLFIRTLGLQVMTSLLQCSSLWSVCASSIWYLFHAVVIYTQVLLQLLAQLVFLLWHVLAENHSNL
jgi:hypothetical protein